jgi:hypothetical protein
MKYDEPRQERQVALIADSSTQASARHLVLLLFLQKQNLDS